MIYLYQWKLWMVKSNMSLNKRNDIELIRVAIIIKNTHYNHSLHTPTRLAYRDINNL